MQRYLELKLSLLVIIKAGYVHRDALFPSESRSPQGGVISPLLANIALNSIKPVSREHYPFGSKVNPIGYADDFVVTVPSKECTENLRKMLSNHPSDR